MVIAGEPLSRPAGLDLGAIGSGGGPSSAAHDGDGCYVSSTELLNPRRRFVHENRVTCDIRDIAGAQPRKLVSTLGPRSLDPLDPVYDLPSCELRPATPPRFLKDSLETRDIWGAQPAIPRQQLIKTRDHIDYSDIAGSRSRPLMRTRAAHSQCDTLDVFDINRGEYKTFRSRRVTDPLSPRYDYDSAHCSSLTKEYSHVLSTVKSEKARRLSSSSFSQKDEALFLIGDIPGNHSVGPAHARQKDLQLYTADIMGEHRVAPPRRDAPRDPCDISDIRGAQADTVKYKPKTRRRTNPLQPSYRFLDYRSKHDRRSVSSQQQQRTSKLEAKGARSMPSTPQQSSGTFSFDLAPSADLTPADPSFAGSALRHGKRAYRRTKSTGTKGLHLSHARGTLKASAVAGQNKRLPPMHGGGGGDKWTSRSGPPFDQQRRHAAAAAMPAFHRSKAKTVTRKQQARGSATTTASPGAAHMTQYEQRRREQRRAADIESVRGLN